MPKPLRALAVVLLALLLALALPYLLVPQLNNLIATRYLRQLTDVPLPEGAALADTFWAVGKLEGNGNSTDYLAAILLDTSLDEAALRAHYEAAGLAPARPAHASHQLHIGTARDGQFRFASGFQAPGPLRPPDDSPLLCVVLYDGGYPALFDLRGH